MSARKDFAKMYHKIYDDTVEEINITDWWRFRKIDKLNSRLRWARHHYNRYKECDDESI